MMTKCESQRNTNPKVIFLSANIYKSESQANLGFIRLVANMIPFIIKPSDQVSHRYWSLPVMAFITLERLNNHFDHS